MRAPKLRWASLGISVVVVVAVGGITLGVTTLLGVTFQGSEPQPAEGAHPSGARNPLTICVQAVEFGAGWQALRGDAAIEAAAKSSVEAALPEVAKHPYWEPAGLDAWPVVVDAGCPSLPPEPYPPDDYAPIRNIIGHIVSEPGPYRLYVFIVPPDDLRALMGASPVRRAGQELVRDEGDTLSGVAGSVFLTAEEIQDEVFLVKLLEHALGLRGFVD